VRERVSQNPEKEGRWFFLWFSDLNCLTETVPSDSAGGKEGEVLPKLEVWEAEAFPWQQQAVRLERFFFHFLFCFTSYQVASFLVVPHSLTCLPFVPCPVSSHVPLPSPPPWQFL